MPHGGSTAVDREGDKEYLPFPADTWTGKCEGSAKLFPWRSRRKDAAPGN